MKEFQEQTNINDSVNQLNNPNNYLLVSDFDMGLIVNFFKGVSRQGPGSTASTMKAMRFLPDISSKTKLLDIGCGTGKQTIVIAKNCDAQITASDLSSVFLQMLRETAAKYDLLQRVSTVEASMDCLPFKNEEFDVIWAEGSIFIIGFEVGLQKWKAFLKKGGYCVVSDVAWFTDSRPKELEDYWALNYPEIDTIGKKIEIMEKAGYEFITSFNLPEECWIDNFYESMKERIDECRKIYSNNQPALDFIQRESDEIDLYLKYSNLYGYTFFIGRKR